MGIVQPRPRARISAAGAVLFSLFAGSCAVPDAAIREVNGNTLPADMSYPRLHGGIEQVADQFCEWVATSQKPFAPSDVDSVAVTTVAGPDGGRYEAAEILTVFLQHDRPRQLTIWLDPRDILARVEQFEPLYAEVVGAGLWTFSKGELAACADGPSGFVSVQFESVQRCIEVRATGVVPESATVADFRNLHLVLSVGLAEQALNLQVMTLHRGDRIVGRIVSASFWADGADVGRIRRICEPLSYPQAFDSSETVQ